MGSGENSWGNAWAAAMYVGLFDGLNKIGPPKSLSGAQFLLKDSY